MTSATEIYELLKANDTSVHQNREKRHFSFRAKKKLTSDNKKAILYIKVHFCRSFLSSIVRCGKNDTFVLLFINIGMFMKRKSTTSSHSKKITIDAQR